MQSLIRTSTRGIFAAAILATMVLVGAPHRAEAKDSVFFDSIVGTWHGPGRIVAGKYKGTRFVCDLSGDPLAKGDTGIAMDGKCRVGIFSQKMSAIIERKKAGYTGRFLDGAKGKGLDVTSGEVADGKAVVGIHRKQLYGAMVASMHGADTMNVTISVQVGEQLVPVIGMTLARQQDSRAVGSID